MIERIPIDAWQHADERHPAPTFFARPAWAFALAHAFRHLEPYPASLALPGRGTVTVPLMRSAGGALRWRDFIGMPLGGYTCALHEDGSPVSSGTWDAALARLTAASDLLTIVPWPLAPIPARGALGHRMHATAIIDLSKGADAALARFEGVVRRMAGQAQRRGVSCDKVKPTQSAIDTYYALVEASAARWGASAPPFPKRLLEGLVAFGGRDVEIWFARLGDEPIGGGVVLYGSQEMFFWSAAMRHEHARLRPSNALNVALIRAAAARGVHWYNLGSSEGLPGVERFKRGLGAAELPYLELHHERGAYRLYSRVRASLSRPGAPA